MANIVPFRAIRPREDLADKIAALPYDVYSREEAYEKVKKDSLSFLRIDRPETQFPADYDMYAPEVYQKGRQMLDEMIENGFFIQDEEACYYIYELIMDGRSQVGIVACASVYDYDNKVIKKHENTRAEKEEDRVRHVDACDAQTGPIFLAYRKKENIEKIVEKVMLKEPVYNFTAEDGITHRIWIIRDRKMVENLQNEFKEMDSVYIADGHHRCASAVRVSKMRRESMKNYTGEEPFNYFLSVLFPDEQLMIMDYNRVVKSLNGYTEEEFLGKAGEIFDIKEIGPNAYAPKKKGEVGMYLNDTWYCLTMKPDMFIGDPVEDLDVAVLQKRLLAPILAIEDPKTDKNIDFVGGIRGLAELERRVHTDSKVAFAMFPTDIHELFAVSDAGRLMPPKSTWFEPKLRSGLFIHSLSDGEM